MKYSKQLIILMIILVSFGCVDKIGVLVDEKNKRAMDYFCENSNYVFRGTMQKQYSKWCTVEEHACTMYELKVGNDVIKIKYLAIHSDVNFFGTIQELPESGVIIKVDPITPVMQQERDYIIFAKKVKLGGKTSIRYIGALIIDKDENVILYNGEKKTVSEFMRILKKRMNDYF